MPLSIEHIRDKETMRRLFMAGAFGNRWAAWSYLEYVMHPEIDVLVTLGYNGRPGLRLPWYGVPVNREELLALADQWQDMGYDKARMVVWQTESLEYVRRFQGEVMRDDCYLSLLWTDVDATMRPALAVRTYHDTGLRAYGLLRQAMDAASWEALQSIWDRWPDAVVEFTCYDRGVGLLGHNTVFWEVREY